MSMKNETAIVTGSTSGIGKKMAEILKGVVAEEGTAHKASIEGVEVAGKTGTGYSPVARYDSSYRTEQCGKNHYNIRDLEIPS